MPLRPMVLALAVLLAGCGGSGAGSGSTGAGELPAGCRSVAEPQPTHVELSRPPLTVSRTATLTADVATSCGSFRISLDAARQPKTVSSFAYLARRGFYDGLTFHKIVPRFVIQGGDPLGDGTGGPGYHVVERPPPDTAYRRGTVAMAKTSVEPPGESGSQLFIVTAPADAGLPPVYAVLGRVTSGMSTVDRIATVPTRGRPRSADPAAAEPRYPVVIERITISKQGPR
jgi:peptidyl-prolyl cis-trans isomerase B (cyclophilin B)